MTQLKMTKRALEQPPKSWPSAPLAKQKSWSPTTLRDEKWLRRKQQRGARHRSKSLTDDDFDELRAAIELGFAGVNSPGDDCNESLSSALPALGFFVAINKSYNEAMSRKSSSSSLAKTSSSSENDLNSLGSPATSPLFSRGADPKTIKNRLRQWAQVVACAVKQSTCS